MKPNKESLFRTELAGVLNKYSLENGSDTPDFILARYLQNCLNAFDIAVTDREGWYGRTKSTGEIILTRKN